MGILEVQEIRKLVFPYWNDGYDGWMLEAKKHKINAFMENWWKHKATTKTF